MFEPETLRRPKMRPNADTPRLCRCTDERDVAVQSEQIDVSVDVVLGGHSVEDKIEAAVVVLHFVGVARYDNFVRPESQCVLLLVGRSRENNHVNAKRTSELRRHVSQSA